MPKLPDTPGLEAAGVIEAVGDGVLGLRVDMRVAAFAGKTYAKYCLAPVTQVVSLPDGVSFTDGAAFLIQGLTAYHLLHTADATGPGRTVLVHAAAGGVGILAVHPAGAAGARVLATVSSDAGTRCAPLHPIATVDRQGDHHPMTEDRDAEHHR